jgi:hypothetical protein
VASLQSPVHAACNGPGPVQQNRASVRFESRVPLPGSQPTEQLTDLNNPIASKPFLVTRIDVLRKVNG